MTKNQTIFIMKARLEENLAIVYITSEKFINQILLILAKNGGRQLSLIQVMRSAYRRESGDFWP